MLMMKNTEYKYGSKKVYEIVFSFLLLTYTSEIRTWNAAHQWI